MPHQLFFRYEFYTAQIPITVIGQADVWVDLYKIPNLPAIPAGSVLRIMLNKQLENPSEMPDDVAWLRQFYLKKPNGQTLDLTLGGHCEKYPGVNGQLGLNITREGHYESTHEGCAYVVKEDIPEGSYVAWRGRAKTARTRGYKLKVWPKGCFFLDIETPCTLQAQVDELRMQLYALTARVEGVEPQ